MSLKTQEFLACSVEDLGNGLAQRLRPPRLLLIEESMTDPLFWRGRWERGEIGWHQAEVEPKLIQSFQGLSPRRVFVPLCGKSLDLVWLHEQGHEVVGVELSDQACAQFFAERGLTPQVKDAGPFRVWSSERYSIFQGDFFELDAALLGPIAAVYDRASLIALPAEVRLRYAGHLVRLLGPATRDPDFRMVLLTLERVPHDEKGPPHSVRQTEVEALYGKIFRVKVISEEVLSEDSTHGTTLKEWLFQLSSSSSS